MTCRLLGSSGPGESRRVNEGHPAQAADCSWNSEDKHMTARGRVHALRSAQHRGYCSNHTIIQVIKKYSQN